jgi:GTP-binding protein HflX
LETDRRLIRNRISALKRQIEQVRQQRALHRRQRARQGVPVLSLVGYTNAGKSTLMRALSGADVLVEDKLFATLDPVTRRFRMPSGSVVLLTDTVGFIQKLPTQLVAAFRATLEELVEAALMLHVVDIRHPDAVQQANAVEATLAVLELGEKPVLTVLNKIDLLVEGDGASLEEALEDEAMQDVLEPWGPDAVVVSAAEGWGLEELRQRVESALAEAATPNV